MIPIINSGERDRIAREHQQKGEGKWYKVIIKEHTCVWSDEWEEKRNKMEKESRVDNKE